jgi:hypothetical protein
VSGEEAVLLGLGGQAADDEHQWENTAVHGMSSGCGNSHF